VSAKSIEDLLPQPTLEEFRRRAPQYDAENRFFHEDLAELKASGYLAAPVPEPLGGAGLGLESMIAAQRRLASFAPATALGANMHLVWVQVARFLHERGDGRLDWVLRDAAAGEIFAFGISEPGNEAVLLDAQTRATRLPEGGYAVSGTKIFTTLSPVWTRLGVHARAESEGEDPLLLFGFVRRDGGALEAGGIEHPGAWNPLGMRATQSYTTRLDGVRIADADVAARMAPFDPSDPLVLGIFASFSLLTSAVYAGIADRAIELAATATQQPMRLPSGETGTRLDDPDIAARVTGAVLEHRASLDALTILARDADERRSREDWFLALAAAKNRVTDEAREAVAVAMRLGGAAAFQADSELARLYRDVLAGMFHPTSSRSLAKTVRGSLAAD